MFSYVFRLFRRVLLCAQIVVCACVCFGVSFVGFACGLMCIHGVLLLCCFVVKLFCVGFGV